MYIKLYIEPFETIAQNSLPILFMVIREGSKATLVPHSNTYQQNFLRRILRSIFNKNFVVMNDDVLALALYK